MSYLLEIKDLTVSIQADTYPRREDNRNLTVNVIDNLTLGIKTGEICGLVGESGSGKTLLAFSIMKLLPEPLIKISSGEIILKGTDILKLNYEALRKIRGGEISLIFQEPSSSLNPVLKIGTQLIEAISPEGNAYQDKKDYAISLLKRVGIPEAESRINYYPHQLSGGMKQRIMIAMAIARNPSLIIADEPTTALDVTIQAEILDLLKNLHSERSESSMLFITHNLGIVNQICDTVSVIYGGEIQETAPRKEFFSNPLHPYSQGLLNSLPDIRKSKRTPLSPIKGTVPALGKFPIGCKFADRCNRALSICKNVKPESKQFQNNHFVKCHLY
ncbi:MAG: ABC transporter ATP-binding protein [Ignavibacteria bacterium]